MQKLCVVVVAAVAAMGAFGGNVYYVDGKVESSGDGKSPETAFKTIQEGIDAATWEWQDTVYIANGHYHLNGTQLNFTNKNGQKFIGESRDGVIIDGDGLSRAAYVTKVDTVLRNMTFTNCINRVDAAFNGGAVYGNGVDVTLSNCTVRCCGIIANEGAALIELNGGGVYRGNCRDCLFESCFITNANYRTDKGIRGGALYQGSAVNCTFRKNSFVVSFPRNYNYNDGGTIYNASLVDGCLFEENEAYNVYSDGGIRGCTVHNCSKVYNSIFRRNTSNCKGICCYDCATITNCMFEANYATRGAGPLVGNVTTVDSCIFKDNVLSDGSSNEASPAMLASGKYTYNCVFVNNRSKGNLGVAFFGADYAHVTNCLFVGNVATNAGGYIVYWNNQRLNQVMDGCVICSNRVERGGNSATLALIGATNAVVRNTLICGNEAKYAVYAGVWDQWANPNSGEKYAYDPNNEEAFGVRLENLTIADNILTDSGEAIMKNINPGIQMRNLLVYGNAWPGTTPDYRYQISSDFVTLQPSKPSAVPLLRYTFIDKRNNNIDKMTTDHPELHNLTADDPGFVNAAKGDYGLKRKAACCDVGTNVAWAVSSTPNVRKAGPRDLGYLSYSYDPDKPGVRVFRTGTHRRIFNGTIDVGAYEYDPDPGLLLMVK